MPKTVFLVDDEKDLLEEVAPWLEQSGFNVVTASSGPEALEKTNQVTPNLFLLDVMMPNMDGFEVLHRLKRNQSTSKVPVIMLTAKGETNAIMRAQELKAVDYVTKPFNTDELLGLIKRYA